MNPKILIFTAVMSLPLSAFAGSSQGDCYGPPEHKVERLTKDLQLSAEQKAKLEVIFKEQHEKFRAFHEESNARVKGVLTPEQMAKWEQLQQQQCQKRMEMRQHKQNP